MMRFVNKKEYWDIEDSGIMSGVLRRPTWHLKSIGDAVTYSFLHELKGKHIAEIGGAYSRLLPALAEHNSCYNIEPYEGVGGGPTTNMLSSNITNYWTYLGESGTVLKPEFFDVVFSISVLEHIETPKFEAFFEDHAGECGQMD